MIEEISNFGYSIWKIAETLIFIRCLGIKIYQNECSLHRVNFWPKLTHLMI